MKTQGPFRSTSARNSGFTLIELVVVIAIIAVLLTLFGIRTGTFGFWRDEGFLRRLSETMAFLNRQAVVDGAFYRIEFDFRKRQYSVGVMQEATMTSYAPTTNSASALGILSLELNEILSPALGRTHTLIPPPSFPSLADPVDFPSGVILERVKTSRGESIETDEENPYILFSPRGFSEFAVLNFRLSDGNPVTLAINPFTGLAQVYRDERDFDWDYGRNRKTTL